MNGEYDAKLARQDHVLAKLEECAKWLRKQYSWQLFLLAMFDFQDAQIDDLVEILESLHGFTDSLVQGFQGRTDLLQKAIELKESQGKQTLAVKDQDSLVHAINDISKLGSPMEDKEAKFLSWSDFEMQLQNRTKDGIIDSGKKLHLDEMQHQYERMYKELSKHSKTNSQILFTPEKLFDMQKQFRDSVHRLQPLLQEAALVRK